MLELLGARSYLIFTEVAREESRSLELQAATFTPIPGVCAQE